jgi:hypothetical protein
MQVPGALTANYSVNLTGNITVDGRDHTVGGTVIDGSNTSDTGACHENKPAVMLTDSLDIVSAGGSTDLYCNPAYASSLPIPCVGKDPSINYVTPEDVLGLDQGELDGLVQDAETYEAPTDSISGIVYVDGDYGSGAAGGNNLTGSGILIVHNPLYDPRQHDPTNAMYDVSIATDPQYAPANLGNINGGTFHGLIIADKIDKINGNIDVIGGVVSLTEIDVTMIGAGTAEILYSCDALQQVGNSAPLPPTRLSWSAN